jgi:hypothetical protein
MEKHNGELFQIEVDALMKDPERFKDLVLEAVNKYFDQSTYDDAIAEHSKKDIYDLVTREVGIFLDNRPDHHEGDEDQ